VLNIPIRIGKPPAEMQAVFHSGEKDVKGNNVTDGLLTKELPEKNKKALSPLRLKAFRGAAGRI
jgi:hypothetical protein